MARPSEIAIRSSQTTLLSVNLPARRVRRDPFFFIGTSCSLVFIVGFLLQGVFVARAGPLRLPALAKVNHRRNLLRGSCWFTMELSLWVFRVTALIDKLSPAIDFVYARPCIRTKNVNTIPVEFPARP